jgi:hypothetical protein
MNYSYYSNTTTNNNIINHQKQSQAEDARKSALEFLKQHEDQKIVNTLPRDNTLEYLQHEQQLKKRNSSNKHAVSVPTTITNSPPPSSVVPVVGWEQIGNIQNGDAIWYRHLTTGCCSLRREGMMDIIIITDDDSQSRTINSSSSPQPSSSQVKPIPFPWKLIRSLQNQDSNIHHYYYWNPITGETTWSIPTTTTMNTEIEPETNSQHYLYHPDTSIATSSKFNNSNNTIEFNTNKTSSSTTINNEHFTYTNPTSSTTNTGRIEMPVRLQLDGIKTTQNETISTAHSIFE